MIKKIIIGILLIGLAGAFAGKKYYDKIYAVNVVGSDDHVLFIPTNQTYEAFIQGLEDTTWIKSVDAFDWVAQQKKYAHKLKPGKYLIRSGWNNNEFVNALRSGEQIPIKLTFNNNRTLEELIGQVSRQFEFDSLDLSLHLCDSTVIRKYGFAKETFPSMFVPNTYYLYWNTSVEDFTSRMAKEYKTFWNASRKQKANQLNLTQSEIVTLASIVEEETKMNDEKPRVAGVYLNRLKRNMLLQADPTIIFAIGNFAIRRVLNKHKDYPSKYNTYLYKGLPPGPIRIPEISSIDAVLNAEQHNYLFFCAKEDFSGYHNFAKSNAEHERNARKYRRALDRKKIFR